MLIDKGHHGHDYSLPISIVRPFCLQPSENAPDLRAAFYNAKPKPNCWVEWGEGMTDGCWGPVSIAADYKWPGLSPQWPAQASLNCSKPTQFAICLIAAAAAVVLQQQRPKQKPRLANAPSIQSNVKGW